MYLQRKPTQIIEQAASREEDFQDTIEEDLFTLLQHLTVAGFMFGLFS